MTQPFLYSVERRYATIPVGVLWRAWTDPVALEQWYCPTNLTVVTGSVTSNPVVGGQWTVAVDVPEAEMIAYFFGVYTEIDEGVRAVHSLNYTQSRGEFELRDESPSAHTVVLDFENRGTASWVKYSQFGELPEGEPDRARAGMESYLDNLARFVGVL